MKLQRYKYNPKTAEYEKDDNGNMYKPEDIEKLEQLNAEMLEMLQELNCDINGMSILLSKGTELRLKSIIDRCEAEGMK